MKIVLTLLTLSCVAMAQVTFKHVRGDVYKYVEVNKPQKVKKGDALEEDETVVLNDGAQVVIKLENHSVHRIEGPAEFSFESFAYEYDESEEIEKPASLLMETGTFFIKVLKKSDNESMLVKTRQTTFGIRGTEFLIDAPKSRDLLLSIHEGAVEVNNGDQSDLIEQGGSLYVENDKTFKKMRDSELKKKVNWRFSELSEKRNFRQLRQERRKNIQKSLAKWNRNELKWSKFKEKRKERLAKWKDKVKNLRSSKKLRRQEMRQKLRKERREKNREKMKKEFKPEDRQGLRDKLRKNKIEEIKQRRLNKPNSFMDNGQRKLRRQRQRQKMIEKRRKLTAPI